MKFQYTCKSASATQNSEMSVTFNAVTLLYLKWYWL